MPGTCDLCGGSLNPDDAFCGHCGHALTETASQTALIAVPAVTTAVPPSTEPGPGPGPEPTPTPTPASEQPAVGPPRAGPPRTDPGRLPLVALTRRNIVYSDEMDSRSTFDPLKNARFLRQLAFRFVIYTGVTGFIDTVILVLTLFAARSSALGIMGTIAPLSWLVLVALFWLLPVPALVGQRTQLLTYRASAAARAFEYISHAFDEHATPRDSLRVRMITAPGQDRRDYLELRDGLFTGYVSCFEHGKDLYIGWTFWLRVSPIRVVLMRIGRNVQNYSGRGGDIYQTFRWESAKASVGAIQACMLDGIEAAINEMDGTAGLALPESKESIMTPVADQSGSAEQQPGTSAQVPWGRSAWAAGAEIANRATMKGE
jgi:hypothetical protein